MIRGLKQPSWIHPDQVVCARRRRMRYLGFKNRMDRDPDADLMSRVASGDEAAMGELVGRWERPVLAFIYRFLACSEDDARDLAQESFLRVWRYRGKWRQVAGFSTWLFTIVSNLCRNRKRDLGRRPMLVTVQTNDSEGADNPHLASTTENPHDLAEATQTAVRVRVAVAGLPDGQRTAVLLRHFGGLRYREIAEVMGTTPAAVDSMLVRARRSLARRLIENSQESEDSGVQR